MNYKIGTRGSKLALVQSEYVRQTLSLQYPEDSFELVIIRTKGDMIQGKPLNQIGDKGLFTAEIEEGLMNGSIDMAVHSMKDMPGEIGKGLIFAEPWKRQDPRDVLVLREAASLQELPQGAVIGTGSMRRIKQLLKLRPDLKCVNIRGNVDTRLRKMKEQKLDGIILAAAGLKRLGMEDVITQPLDTAQMLPAPAQGTLALEVREDNRELLAKLNALADPETILQTRAERAFLVEIGASCHMPVGAYCKLLDDVTLQLSAVYGTDADSPLYYAEATGVDPEALAHKVVGTIRSKIAQEKGGAVSYGKVILLGAGPGDPGLITVKGMDYLKQADCVVYDRLSSPELLAWARPDADLFYVGKSDHHHTLTQDMINELLVEKAALHKLVVRLKGGDPYVFGRGGEEAIFLREHGVEFEVVPGISSALAGLAYAGIPITHRGVATGFHVVTAHDKRNQMTELDFQAMLDPKITCVFLMGLGMVRQLADRLMEAGRSQDTPAAVISCATTSQQRTCTATLSTIADAVDAAQLPSPALIVVGDVVKLRNQLSTFETRPLFGQRYLVPKIGTKASALSQALESLGAEIDEVLTGEVTYHDFDPSCLEDADWIIFTSQHGVKAFFASLQKTRTDMRLLYGRKFAVVGQKTAGALEKFGIYADLIAAKASGEELAKEIKPIAEAGARICYFKAAGIPDQMPESVCRIEVYTNGEAEAAETSLSQDIDWNRYDGVFFTAASNVSRTLRRDQGEGLRRRIAEAKREGRAFRIYSIGQVCAQALGNFGVSELLIPEDTSYEGLIRLCVEENRGE